MNFEELLIMGNNFYYDHQYITIIVIAVILILLYLKPKQFLKLVITLFALGAVFYVISMIGEATFTGISQKGKIVNKSP
ncbi:MAG: hypothetical protein JRI61_05780 [Deltaproteobacteria bacterium]|nr:hypothetical protein [Deltaproteobacteria bacterium]